MSEKPEILTPEEVAALLRLDVSSVRRLLRDGDLPGFKVGGQWRVARVALDQHMKTPSAA